MAGAAAVDTKLKNVRRSLGSMLRLGQLMSDGMLVPLKAYVGTLIKIEQRRTVLKNSKRSVDFSAKDDDFSEK